MGLSKNKYTINFVYLPTKPPRCWKIIVWQKIPQKIKCYRFFLYFQIQKVFDLFDVAYAIV